MRFESTAGEARILFYLPVVTPWWFDNIVVHMIRACAKDAEVHVMVPPVWKNTGIHPQQLANCDDLGHVFWHILDDEDHPSLRSAPADPQRLLEQVRAIDPDYTICRSAETVTPASFPGEVRYVMEAGVAPLSTLNHWVVLQPDLFDHGCMPRLADDERSQLHAGFAAEWQRLRERYPGVPADEIDAYRERVGLPADRPIIALPLEYEHKENWFRIQRRFERNADLVHSLGQELGKDVFLAITNHPLNERFVSSTRLERAVEELEGRGALVRTGDGSQTTIELASLSAGMMLENSKTYGTCAFFGRPLLRASRFRTGDWLNVYDDPTRFVADVKAGVAKGAANDDAMTWFAFHVANDMFDARDPAFNAEALAERFDKPFDPTRWGAGFDRYFDFQRVKFG